MNGIKYERVKGLNLLQVITTIIYIFLLRAIRELCLKRQWKMAMCFCMQAAKVHDTFLISTMREQKSLTIIAWRGYSFNYNL